MNDLLRAARSQAQAKLKEAQADATTARAFVSRCNIPAPFSGRVAKRHTARGTAPVRFARGACNANSNA